jgi:hypothetical protein
VPPPWYLPNGEKDWSSRRGGRAYFTKLTHTLSNMSEKNRAILMATAIEMSRRFRGNGHQPVRDTLW